MKRNLMLLIGLVSMLEPACRAQAQLAGDWQGTLSAGSVQLRLVLHVTAAKDGSLTATMDSVDQGAYAIPVTTVTFKDSKFSLVVDAVHGTYEGTVNERRERDRRHVVAGPANRSHFQPLRRNAACRRRPPPKAAAPPDGYRRHMDGRLKHRRETRTCM